MEELPALRETRQHWQHAAALMMDEADVGDLTQQLHLALFLGRFNVVQMAIGVRTRGAAALPTIDEFVNRIRSDGTVQKAITEAGLRGVRVP